jgi:hypothetical protein
MFHIYIYIYIYIYKLMWWKKSEKISTLALQLYQAQGLVLRKFGHQHEYLTGHRHWQWQGQWRRASFMCATQPTLCIRGWRSVPHATLVPGIFRSCSPPWLGIYPQIQSSTDPHQVATFFPLGDCNNKLGIWISAASCLFQALSAGSSSGQHEGAAAPMGGHHMAGRQCPGAPWQRRRRGAAAVEDRRREGGPRRRRCGARQGVPFGSWAQGQLQSSPPLLFGESISGSLTVCLGNLWIVALQGENSEWVDVEFFHPNPSSDDWIGVFSPANFR